LAWRRVVIFGIDILLALVPAYFSRNFLSACHQRAHQAEKIRQRNLALRL